MSEKTIYLEGIDPMMLYGVHNMAMERINRAFPKLKIIPRGNEIKVVGEPQEIYAFEEKIREILDFIHHHNTLTEDELSALLDDSYSAVKNKKDQEDTIIYGVDGQPIKARTVNQACLVKEASHSDLILAIGPAGTGKTYTAIALAVRSLKNKEVRRIILTRPAVEAGEHLGFLPGDVRDKLDPYLQPLYDALRDMVPFKKLNTYLEDETIQIAPLAFMRGRTLENAFVILDEGQNATVNQLKMFLTRMGMNSKFIVTGDVTQIDLPRKKNSGLLQAIKILEGISGISIVQFGQEDIVRHPLVKDIVDAYDKENHQKSVEEEDLEKDAE
ncbi:MAG TPA: PhoH family protein [Bacteroidetes bacterium]|nr:PhoH family protein [Bacteroidota bacterium]